MMKADSVNVLTGKPVLKQPTEVKAEEIAPVATTTTAPAGPVQAEAVAIAQAVGPSIASATTTDAQGKTVDIKA